ncbi:MAG: hypothetical protein JJT93_01960 [Gammaproteobacteria bacterium]|nr:hypothetical protein [Gammaproteobacteria bacterium]
MPRILSPVFTVLAALALVVTSACANESPATDVANAANATEAAAPAGGPAVFVTVTAEDNQTRGMAMVLSRQMHDQGAALRILLCGPGGELAIDGIEATPLAPRGVTPQQLLRGLIADGVTVEVCAIFLPNTEWESEDMIEGVGTAMPPDVAAYMLGEGVRYFTF